MMEVHLKYRKCTKIISNINLHNGYRPRVGYDSNSTESVPMEPAIWFKCLVISYVHIDCDQRRIKFRKSFKLGGGGGVDCGSANGGTNDTLRSSNTLCTHGRLSDMSVDVTDGSECYDFECLLDELFDQTAECLIKFDHKSISEDTFHSCVLRLLHCFVFPSVKFTTSDLPLLLLAQDHINIQVSDIEKKIVKQDKLVFFTETSLKSQRERLFRTENFHKESYVRQCCKTEFLDLLLKDVERDVFKYDQLLDECQTKINDLKLKESETNNTLQSFRKDRDIIHQQLASLENIRENIKNVIIRPTFKKKKFRRKKKVQNNVFHEIYIEVSKKLFEQKDILQNKCFSKVKVVTVREAITMSIRDIQTVGETLGIDIKIDGSERATDILDINLKPDHWKTHNEKIALLLVDPNQRPYNIHNSFCSSMKDRIKGTVDEYSMFRIGTLKKDSPLNFVISPIELTLLNRNGDSSHQRRLFRFDSISSAYGSFCDKSSNSVELPVMRTSALEDSFSSGTLGDRFKTLPMKSSLDTICKDIKTHLQKMSTDVLPQVFQTDDIAFAKLWLIYESHLYLNLMDDLILLYTTAYETVCQNLLNNISKFSITEFVNEDNFVQKLFFKQDLSDNASLQVDSGRNSSNEEDDIINRANFRLSSSLENLKWKGNMVKNLYERADEDCSNLMDSITLCLRSNSLKSSVESVESFLESLPTNCTNSITEPADVKVEIQQKDENSQYDFTMFKQQFMPALICIDNLLLTSSIVGKLRCLTRMFRILNTTISALCSSNNKEYYVCSDEILTASILLLVILVDRSKLKQFYIHIMIMIDLMAPCLNGGIHDCSLTNFFSAFQFIFDRIFLMTQKR